MNWVPLSIRHVLPLTRQYWELRAYRGQSSEVLAQVREMVPREAVDELAVPSYTHRNRLMRYLFHERLAVALEWIDGLSPAPSVLLDFGCGTCLLSPMLQHRRVHYIACDIHPEVAAAAMACFGVKDAEVIDARAGLAEVRPASVDVILALDVLEHVDDVRAVAARFREMMSPTGRLLCSLPTENALYRLGRRLAGFSGAYHLREPRAVVRDLTTVFRVKRVARLYPFLPFFDFYEAAT